MQCSYHIVLFSQMVGKQIVLRRSFGQEIIKLRNICYLIRRSKQDGKENIHRFFQERSSAGCFSKEVRQLKKELAEAQRKIEETCQELQNAKMENQILKKKWMYSGRSYTLSVYW